MSDFRTATGRYVATIDKVMSIDWSQPDSGVQLRSWIEECEREVALADEREKRLAARRRHLTKLVRHVGERPKVRAGAMPPTVRLEDLTQKERRLVLALIDAQKASEHA